MESYSKSASIYEEEEEDDVDTAEDVDPDTNVIICDNIHASYFVSPSLSEDEYSDNEASNSLGPSSDSPSITTKSVLVEHLFRLDNTPTQSVSHKSPILKDSILVCIFPPPVQHETPNLQAWVL